MCEIIKFCRSFDGTNMTINQIRDKARALGWPGLRISAPYFVKTGQIKVERMTKREVSL